jgi:hypothetical protein
VATVTAGLAGGGGFTFPADRKKVRAGDDGDVGGGSGVSQVNAAAETAGGSGLGWGAGGSLSAGTGVYDAANDGGSNDRLVSGSSRTGKPVASAPSACCSSVSPRLQETGPVAQESRPVGSGLLNENPGVSKADESSAEEPRASAPTGASPAAAPGTAAPELSFPFSPAIEPVAGAFQAGGMAGASLGVRGIKGEGMMTPAGRVSRPSSEMGTSPSCREVTTVGDAPPASPGSSVRLSKPSSLLSRPSRGYLWTRCPCDSHVKKAASHRCV